MRRKKLDLITLKDTPPWDWSEDTGKRLLDLLRDERTPEAERLLALDLAGDSTVIDDDLADALLAHLGDAKRDEETRIAAVLSLGPVLEHTDLMGFDDADDIAISERTFQRIQDSLHRLYTDASLPVELRRRILEAAVRAPQGWHEDAIRAAYADPEGSWKLTAVFCMRFVRGFDEQILESLHDADPAIRCEAVLAAGTWGLEAAFPHVSGLLRSTATEKPLLMAAIEAIANIRPKETPQLLEHLAGSEDEDIRAAVAEALDMAEVGPIDEDDLDWLDEGEDEDDEEGDDGPVDPKLLN